MRQFSFLLVLLWCVSCTKKQNNPAQVELHTYGFKIYQPVQGSTVTAGFGEFKNLTDKEMQVEVVDSNFFKSVELHNMVTTADNLMKMEKVNTLKIAPKKSLVMKSGSYHMMFYNPKKELKLGHEIPVNIKINGKVRVIGFKVIARD